MHVYYLDCQETWLCCYLVIHIENLLRPLRLFYFHLWHIYWPSPVCSVTKQDSTNFAAFEIITQKWEKSTEYITATLRVHFDIQQSIVVSRIKQRWWTSLICLHFVRFQPWCVGVKDWKSLKSIHQCFCPSNQFYIIDTNVSTNWESRGNHMANATEYTFHNLLDENIVMKYHDTETCALSRLQVKRTNYIRCNWAALWSPNIYRRVHKVPLFDPSRCTLAFTILSSLLGSS
jgi:hypothetical protein